MTSSGTRSKSNASPAMAGRTSPFTRRAVLWGIAATSLGSPLGAQSASAAGPSGGSGADSSLYAPLTLAPAPSAVRLASGAPGPKYWQNRADFDLKATLDTTTSTVHGEMTLRYTNNSPDTLKVMWFQTEQPTYVIERFDQVVGGQAMALTYQHPGSDTFEIQAPLAKPLPPGQTATFHAVWHFGMSKATDFVPHESQRMGREGPAYYLGQWYPRPNVYDDVKGWNTESFASGSEFYLDYGDYNLEVTLPAGYIVAATGTLDNPQEVLTSTERARLAQAATVDTVVRVITEAELSSGAARPTTAGMLTWKFRAKNVRDAVWCAGPNFQWDATQWHHIMAYSYYRPANAAAWSDGADQARMSIQEYSERWFQYPWPQVTAVDGGDGMEYPMISYNGAASSPADLYGTLTHEVGHNWFPMIVGSNERVHTWMDEGFNTFINTFSEARRYPAAGDQASQLGTEAWKGNGSILETGVVIGNTGAQYGKTAYVLEILRRDILGPAVFDSAFRTYIRRWAFKHPTPMDFFRTMNEVSGKNLDWFWHECFLEAPRFDQAIDSVQQTVQGGETHLTVTYENKARAIFPLLVHLTFSDSTTQDIAYPTEVWRTNPKTYTVSYTFTNKTVRRIELDPGKHLPDVDRTNNVWMAK